MPEDAGPPVSPFDGWETLYDLLRLQRELPAGEPTLVGILEPLLSFGPSGPGEDTVLGDFRQALSDLTGWQVDALEELIGPSTFAFSLADLIQVQNLRRLQTCFVLMRRTGASVEQLKQWRASNVTPTIAANIKRAVKAKYTTAGWLQVAGPLRDLLRERQRQALVDYVVGKEGLRDSDDLFEHLLIDVEMSACQMTSRIKQALSSVQLFVQRCLMNLEPEVTLSPDDAQRWQWMKNYRVWEANRKIFLYPENWIEPELRDDKSPPFQELENELLQNQVTDQLAEEVFLRCLEKFNETAHLEVCGLYQDHFVLHVFARTRGEPHIYYYRKRVGQACWTAWERVDLDIQGDHLIPVVHNGRLYLFWPIFTEKTDRTEEETIFSYSTCKAIVTDQERRKYWEIKLAWSEYKNGKWIARRISQEALLARFIPVLEFKYYAQSDDEPNSTHTDKRFTDEIDWTRQEFFFQTQIGDGALRLLCNRMTLPYESESKDFKDNVIYWGCFRFDPCSGDMIPEDQLSIDLVDGLEHADTSKGNQLHVVFDSTRRDDYSYYELVDISSDKGHRAIWVPQPSKQYFMEYIEDRTAPQADALELPMDHRDESGKPQLSHELVLGRTPGTFHILPAHQAVFRSKYPFFYRDDDRTFLVLTADHYQKIQAGDPVWMEADISHPHIGTLIKVESAGRFVLNPHVPYDPSLPFGFLDPSQPFDPSNPFNPQGWFKPYNPYFLHDTKDCMTMQPVLEDGLGYIDLFGYDQHMSAGFRGTSAATRQRYGASSSPLTVAGDTTISAGDFSGTASADLSGFFVSDHLLPSSELLKCVGKQYRFTIFYHPHICTFIAHLRRYGVKGLLDPDPKQDTIHLRRQQVEGDLDFGSRYGPSEYVKDWREVVEDVGFSSRNVNAVYNWEIFFHAPFLIATRLSDNQRFAEARQWFHYIFDPTAPPESGVTGPKRFWKTKPFYEATILRLRELLMLFHEHDPVLATEWRALHHQIGEWRTYPFEPHRIARLRHVAYMKAVVIKYLDNLIAWGDQLFRRDTIESINEATQLYILAAQILGPRPQSIPARQVPELSFNELVEGHGLDAFSNALVEVETRLPPLPQDVRQGIVDAPVLGKTFFFCIPKNDKLLRYWDTIADRLFKIRHCMNIEGVVRQLPLFEPPIDPGLLVRAVAAGVDISAAISDLYAPLPHYRFQVMLQKAVELCHDVKALGAALLSALEKRDAEALALLRSGHELQLLEAIRQIKKLQVNEAEEAQAALNKGKEAIEIQDEYYRNIPKTIEQEELQLDLMDSSTAIQAIQGGSELAAGVLHLIPEETVGFLGIFPVITLGHGGPNIAGGLQAFAGALGTTSSILNTNATKAGTTGSQERRWDEWKLQEKRAGKELEQIEKQITAAEIRLAIAENELENHDLQTENAKEVDAYMRDKFTNQQLYNWMVSQISALYFQSYQMAYDLAKRAEKAFQHELGVTDTSYVQFGYWDSLKKGLLAGERLGYDLKRMEVAYLDQNRREYELTKHVSLAMLDPVALVMLKETGECFTSLPEAIFDLDFPGHYMRRIKSVSLTIPCVTGPYTSVSCTLTLQGNRIRRNTDLRDDRYAWTGDYEDDRFLYDVGGIQSIATSSGQSDSGLFELNFRDERYLPFEGAGAISSWHIELPQEFRQFDYDTISDVVIHLHYTAREGGTAFKGEVEETLSSALTEMVLQAGREGLYRLFSAKQEFPNEWHQFLYSTEDHPTLALELGTDRFPLQFQDEDITIDQVALILQPEEGITNEDAADIGFEVKYPDPTIQDQYLDQYLDLQPMDAYGGLPGAVQSVSSRPGSWSLEATNIPPDLQGEDPDRLKIQDIGILLHYTISLSRSVDTEPYARSR